MEGDVGRSGREEDAARRGRSPSEQASDRLSFSSIDAEYDNLKDRLALSASNVIDENISWNASPTAVHCDDEPTLESSKDQPEFSAIAVANEKAIPLHQHEGADPIVGAPIQQVVNSQLPQDLLDLMPMDPQTECRDVIPVSSSFECDDSNSVLACDIGRQQQSNEDMEVLSSGEAKEECHPILDHATDLTNDGCNDCIESGHVSGYNENPHPMLCQEGHDLSADELQIHVLQSVAVAAVCEISETKQDLPVDYIEHDLRNPVPARFATDANDVCQPGDVNPTRNHQIEDLRARLERLQPSNPGTFQPSGEEPLSILEEPTPIITQKNSAASVPSAGVSMSLAEFELIQTREHEYEDLKLRHTTLWADFRGLESTLEELMGAYEKQIETTQQQKSDHRASDELRQLEIARLHSNVKEVTARLLTLDANYSDTTALNAKLSAEILAITSDRDKLVVELHTNDAKFEKLKEQATTKLKMASEKFKAAQEQCTHHESRANRLDSELSELQNRSRFLNEELDKKRSQCAELTDRTQALTQSLRDKEQEASNSARYFVNVKHELQIAKRAAAESNALSDRYKHGLAEANEKNRALQDEIDHFSSVQMAIPELHATIEQFRLENSILKSRLFDSMESQKAMQEQMQLAPGSGSEGDGAIRQELKRLRHELDVKSTENRELVQISNELLASLEQSKLRSAN